MKNAVRFRVALVVMSVSGLMTFVRAAVAQTETVLYTLTGKAKGFGPQGSLVLDKSGNLYGTTANGGIYGGGDSRGFGTVFELTPSVGGWNWRMLYKFPGSPNGGSSPSSGLISDTKGNLYGTTYAGGTDNAGTVFELAPTASSSWKEKQIYAFGATQGDGSHPEGPLTFDDRHNLYGTTFNGGAYGEGSVFKLAPAGAGAWTETVLYSFAGDANGGTPSAGVVLDNAENLYGTAATAGPYGYGDVFELSPQGGGGWTLTVLHGFTAGSNDGRIPSAPLIFDGQGNLYGSTAEGGSQNQGTVFELTPAGSGLWTETVIYSFQIGSSYGAGPSGLVFDTQGNLDGTTSVGTGGKGCYEGLGCGTVFQLRPITGGWSYSLLYSFTGGSDGGQAGTGGLILDQQGNLYGTTTNGGNLADCSVYLGCGVVFKIAP
jgi:uncharacterized repeat protein (TIGR03803 family)